MAQIDQVSYGKVFSHIASLFSKATGELRLGTAPNTVAQMFREDAVFPAVSSGAWRPPAPHGRQMPIVRRAVEDFERALSAHTRGLEVYSQTAIKALDGFSEHWDATSYFIVPVIEGRDQPGLVYLQARPVEHAFREVRRRLSIEDLTQDATLLDYFDSLPIALMKRFFFVNNYPFDPYRPMSHFAYRLMFGCQITEGKSVGAATVAMLCVAYLKLKLRVGFDQAVAPRHGTLLTGEIDPEGLVHQVDNINEKISCALQEYGSGLKVIVPAENRLGDLERQIDRGNLFYVSTVDELLAAVLDSPVDRRGLESARDVVFRELEPDDKRELIQHLFNGVPANIYDAPRNWSQPVPHAEGVYSIVEAWESRVDVHVAPHSLILKQGNSSHDGRTLIEVFIDGSAAMDPHWAIDGELGTSRLAAAIFQISSRLDHRLEELVVAFLACDRQEAVRDGTSAKDIHAMLLRVRNQEQLRERGAVLRPAWDKSLDLHGARRKRAYLVSDSVVPDWIDVKDPLAESAERLVVFSDGTRSSDVSTLFTPDGHLNHAVLDGRFNRAMVAMPELCVTIGAQVPVEVEPPGDLSVTDDGVRVRWSEPSALAWHVRLRLAGLAPRNVTVSGTVIRHGETRPFSFAAMATRTPLDPIGQIVEGVLSDAELERWRTICDETKACPDASCGKLHVHLAHEPELRLDRRLIFDVPDFRGQWFLLRAGGAKWMVFRHGCRFDGLTIAVVDRTLHYSESTDQLRPVPSDAWEEGLYRINHDSDTLFITAL